MKLSYKYFFVGFAKDLNVWLFSQKPFNSVIVSKAKISRNYSENKPK